MYTMPVTKAYAMNGYPENDERLLSINEAQQPQHHFQLSVSNAVVNGESATESDEVQGMHQQHTAVLGVHLCDQSLFYTHDTHAKRINLGIVVLCLKSNTMAEDLREFINTQLAEKLPCSYDFLTAKGWPIQKNQECNVLASQLINEFNIICIQRRFEKPMIGVCNHTGENLGFIFVEYTFSIQQVREALEDQLKDVIPTKREYKFLQRNGWPIKPCQEAVLTLLDLLQEPPHICVQFGERISSPPPLSTIHSRQNNIRVDAPAEVPTSTDQIDSAGPVERKSMKNWIRDISSIRRVKENKLLVAKAILISYVRAEAAQQALQLKEELCNLNFSVYLDVHEIKPAFDWQDSLNFAVSNCHVFVPLITPLYGKTQWTNREVKLADVLNKIIIPVNFTDTWPPDCLAIQFASTQYICAKVPQEEYNRIQCDTKLWPKEQVKRTAKSISERYPSTKCHAAKNRSLHVSSDVGKVNPVFDSSEAPTEPLIVISVHPSQRTIAIQLSQVLKKEGYLVWASCEPHVFTVADIEPEISGTQLPPITPRELPTIREDEMFLSQHEGSTSIEEPMKSTKQDKDHRPLVRTMSNISEINAMGSLSSDKMAQLRLFQSKVYSARLVLVVASRNYYASKFSQQQAFFCEHRKRIFVIGADHSSVPNWFTILLGKESLNINNDHFWHSLKGKVKKAMNPGIMESSTDTVAEAKIHCLATFMKSNGLPNDTCLYIVGSSKIQSPRTTEICKAIGEELAKVHNITIVTGGFYGVPEVVGESFNSCISSNITTRSSIVHVLPKKDDQDYSSRVRQNRDGTFEPLPYGKSIFVGDSIRERESAIARVIDTCVLIEGGQAAAHEVEEFIWNDHFVIPVRSTGGAAGGSYGVPIKIFDIPLGVSPEDWDMLSNTAANPVEIAKAVVNIIVVIKQTIASHTNKTQELRAAALETGRSRKKRIREIGAGSEVTTNRNSRILPTTPSKPLSSPPSTHTETFPSSRKLGSNKKRTNFRLNWWHSLMAALRN